MIPHLQKSEVCHMGQLLGHLKGNTKACACSNPLILLTTYLAYFNQSLINTTTV